MTIGKGIRIFKGGKLDADSIAANARAAADGGTTTATVCRSLKTRTFKSITL